MRSLAYIALGFVNLASVVMCGFVWRNPGGLAAQSMIPPMLGGVSLLACVLGFRSVSTADRIARMICGAVAIFVIGLFTIEYQQYRDSMYHAYHG